MKKFFILSVLLMFMVSTCAFDFPHINDISPDKGLIGAEITITGLNFGTINDEHLIYFGGVTVPAQNIVSWESNQILMSVPNGAKSGEVIVKVKGRSSNSIHFTVIEFSPVPDDLITAVVTDNPGMLSYIRTDPDKGFYLLGEKFQLKEGEEEIHPEFVKILDNIPFTFISGWYYNGDGSSQFMVKGFSRYTSDETESILTDGLVVDVVYHDGIIYACNYQGRAIEKIDVKEWSLKEPLVTTVETPYEYPWRLFYSSSDTALILITRSIWAGESGRVLKYDLQGNQIDSSALPPMNVYDVDYVSDKLLIYGWNDDKPLVKVYPLFSSTETSYARYITYESDFVKTGGFKIAPDNQSVIVSDQKNGTILSFNNVIGSGYQDVEELMNFGNSITEPAVIDTIRGVPYVLVKSANSGISIVDTSINAFYGTINFEGEIKGFDYKIYDYR